MAKKPQQPKRTAYKYVLFDYKEADRFDESYSNLDVITLDDHSEFILHMSRHMDCVDYYQHVVLDGVYVPLGDLIWDEWRLEVKACREEQERKRQEILTEQRAWDERRMKKMQAENERREYERLKAKFEGEV